MTLTTITVGTCRAWLGWTDEKRDQCIALHAKGLSFSKIAAELGTTKNSVIGFAHRENLPKRTKQGALIGEDLATPRVPKSAATKAKSRSAEPPKGGISYMQQRDGLCRWPLTDDVSFYAFRACGCACANDRPYCTEHTKRASAGRPVPAPRVRQRGGMMPRNHVFAGAAE
jgi:GcrA cell cycle regulator